MSIVWKIIRIIGLYVGSFFACILIAVIALSSLPDTLEALFALLAPIAFVWWYENRRAAKNSERKNFTENPVSLDSEEQQLRLPKAFQTLRSNAELVWVGQRQRAELETAAEPIGVEKLEGQSRPNQLPAKHSQSEWPNRMQPTRLQGWVPKGQSVTISGRTINGMVYVGQPPRIGSSYYGESCRAFIDPSLSVARVGSDKNGDHMPYWPGYSSIPAVCRATYLDWLAGDREDGTVNPGYMFLFFYGLERRFMVEQPSDDERREIVKEVERLKCLFSENYSAQRYLGEFVDLARIAAMGKVSLCDPALKQTILENRNWDVPFSLKFALGGIIANGNALDWEWLHLWLMCHPERRLRTPAERCGEEFKALFKLKFEALYPEGLMVRTPRKLLKMEYRAASSEFNCSVSPATGDGGDVAIPDVSDLRSPVQKAQKIADEAMDELDKFSRYLGRNPDGRGTIEAQALLPAELWGLLDL